MNLARQHFLKHSAKAAAVSAAEFGTMESQTAYELQLMQLNNDRRRLKQIQSTEAKIQLKQGLVPTYLPYVDGIMEANTGVQDEVFMTVLVWCIDTGNYAKALEMAEFALWHNMIMPDRFERKTATLVTEEIANAFFISENTVRTHIYNIFKKISVNNRTQAACWANSHLRSPVLEQLP